jgi:hypothetical protein
MDFRVVPLRVEKADRDSERKPALDAEQLRRGEAALANSIF